MIFHRYAFTALLLSAHRAQHNASADPLVTARCNGKVIKNQDILAQRRLKPGSKSSKHTYDATVGNGAIITSTSGKSNKTPSTEDQGIGITTIKSKASKSTKTSSKAPKAGTLAPSSSPSGVPATQPSVAPTEDGIIPNDELLLPKCLRRNYVPPTPKPSPRPFATLPPVKLDTAEPTTGEGSVPPTDENVTFRRGDLSKNIRRLGIRVARGMSVRVVATANERINFANGDMSSLPFHGAPDGAAVFAWEDGGHVYVSNSDRQNKRGGVYAMYFDKQGDVVDYKMLLSDTTRNSSGGKTPFNTWLSCEEYAQGQCWQVDPEGRRNPEMTVLGGEGGNYEAVACDDRNPLQPIFYVTEDNEFGALRKFIPVKGPAGWDTLNGPGTTEYLVFLDDKTFTWRRRDNPARTSQSIYYPNVEGIDFKDGILYFVSKRRLMLYALDLDNNTYTMAPTNEALLGGGEFKNSPDQLIRNEGDFLYFTEDGGKTPGVYAVDSSGQRFAIFEAYGKQYFGDETTGLAFSPDGTKMYACFQDCGCKRSGEGDCGCMLEFWRNDGRSFDGATMNLKYHLSE